MAGCSRLTIGAQTDTSSSIIAERKKQRKRLRPQAGYT